MNSRKIRSEVKKNHFNLKKKDWLLISNVKPQTRTQGEFRGSNCHSNIKKIV